MTPRFTVVTATYERPDMLRAACASVRAQTVGDWEHLIIDDGSTSLEQEEAMYEAAAAIHYGPSCTSLSFGAHLDRPAAHWNAMIAMARGEYVTILDDDCEKHPTFFEVMGGYLDEHSDVDLVTCGFVAVAQLPDRSTRHHINGDNLETPQRIWHSSTVDTNCWLARRAALDVVGPWPDWIRTCEDWWFMRRAQARLTVHHLPECLVEYKIHPAQRMHTREALGNEAVKARILAEEP